MAANRFATLIHRKTNRITLVLIYAFLEWSLIFLILLNSLLSYFILRFADYFGLKRPCLFCSRLDRFFDSSGKSPSHKDLLCDDHSQEISKETSTNKGVKDLVDCKTCFASLIKPKKIRPNLTGGKDKQIHNGNLFMELSRSISFIDEESISLLNIQQEEEQEVSNESADEEFTGYVSSFDRNKQVKTEQEENKVDLVEESGPLKNLEFYIDEKDSHLIPVESYKPVEEIREISDINGDFILDFGAETNFTAEDGGGIISEKISAFILLDESKPDDTVKNVVANSTTDDLLEMQNEEETEDDGGGLISDDISAFVSPDESKPDDTVKTRGKNSTTDEMQNKEETEEDVSSGTEEMQNKEETEDDDVSIGTEIPNHDQIGTIQSHNHIHNEAEEEEEEGTLEFKTTTIEIKKPIFHVSENRTESIESTEGVVVIVDKLKSELEEERKVLNALYEELEEERSASAIAANETMAMINRLHEEKAAMQMEALQYQRMMEEQSEFDQEALQLLNEVIVKREKENAELEKELEVCRKRLEELRRRMRGSSVDSFRTNGDLDESHVGGGEENGEMGNTPVDVVVRLDECLDDYEGERLSILERLKKLTSFNDEEEVKTVVNNGNGRINGMETNGEKHRVIKSKRLLPLFDAVDGEMGDHEENGVDESEKGEDVTVEEEVDELYERLEALEADREFLRHCVGSLKKGDKGLHLLNEILQNMRDLKNIDFIRVSENEDMNF